MKYVSIILIALFSIQTRAQVKTDEPLYKDMQRMDNLLFEEGFNNCNYKTLEDILAPDLEFYHDNGGMQNKQEFIDATRKNICGSAYGKITRKAVSGSIEVFPLYKNEVLYGVFVTGKHEFFLQPTGKPVEKTGVAKFSCLWLRDNKGQWLLKRVVSYDHKPAQ